MPKMRKRVRRAVGPQGEPFKRPAGRNAEKGAEVIQG